VAGRRRKRLDLTTPGLLGLPVMWLVAFFLVPIGIVGAYSIDIFSIYPAKHPVTLAGWDDFVHSAIYLKLFWKSVRMSLLVSVVVVLLAYPVAYYLALSGTKRKYVLLLILIAPFLTSYLLRVLAWKVILGSNGVVNSFLYWLGVRAHDDPVSQLLYSRFAVMLVLVYVWLPFVALPIFVSLETLDRNLLEAASDLYASRWQAFRRVTLPLSMPGVVAAFLFVFIPTVGEFVTPSLVGGTSGYMYGNQISDLFGTGFPDWRTGSVLALFLLAVVALLTGVFARFLGMRDAGAH
jgi:spermidine/putrescine transport system permease protein